MEGFFAGAVPVIWSVAGTALITFIGFAAKKLRGFNVEHSTNNQVAVEHEKVKSDIAELKADVVTLTNGVRMILKSQMVTEHGRLVRQRFATPSEKDHFEEMHKNYKALGGNGTGTAMYNDVMEMYSISPKEGGNA